MTLSKSKRERTHVVVLILQLSWIDKILTFHITLFLFWNLKTNVTDAPTILKTYLRQISFHVEQFFL